MKTLKILVVCLFTCCFAGCFEMNEELSVRENGSGEFSINMDMGQLVDMMKAFMPPAELEKMGQQKDTVINMKDLVDTSTALSADNKALLRDGTLRMQMNIEDKVFKINMKYPFKNLETLQQLYANLGNGSTGMGGLLNGMRPGSSAMGGKEPEMKQVSSYFDLETKKNSITRKLNKERYATLLDDSMMQQMKQMGSMGGGLGTVKMNTVIKLPTAAKKLTGSKAELSTDKKTVLLKNNLLDIFEHPEVFEFSVNY
ncbi:MAG: hypothetical protein WKF89_05410 [Chitinophagaceae bacterium]